MTGDHSIFMQVVLFILDFIRIVTCVYICVRPRSPHDWMKRNGQDSDSSPSSRPQKHGFNTDLYISMEREEVERAYWCQETCFRGNCEIKGLCSADER